MGRATPDRSPDVLTRVAAGVVVPVVAVAAHGLGAGSVPGSAGMLLSVGIGALVALFLGGQRQRSVTTATLATAGLLTLAQIGSHLSLMAGQTQSAMHHDALLPMLLTHLIAIPSSAALIVVAAGLLRALTSTMRRLSPPPRVAAPPHVAVVRWVAPHLYSGVVVGGVGVRGPPGLS
ncbi:YtxH domain-containing protein [Gordonia sp. SID5947]|uniref:YtxH domain-containing protein n=1 Tax=Gordonia sp. SID5947 TaxID=2690315 RepID=UPI0013717F45|nr:YtxH domain-containing protein [Gordonia sp. SID5947]MYR06672.1 YtxH domain-containing protein [Gordonia sp. SID5947]